MQAFWASGKARKLHGENHSKLVMGPELELSSQFRCLGGETYTSFVKSMLQYNDEGIKFNKSLDKYDLRVFDSPKDMYELIK